MTRTIKRYRITEAGLEWMRQHEEQLSGICRFCGKDHFAALCEKTIIHALADVTGYSCTCVECGRASIVR